MKIHHNNVTFVGNGVSCLSTENASGAKDLTLEETITTHSFHVCPLHLRWGARCMGKSDPKISLCKILPVGSICLDYSLLIVKTGSDSLWTIHMIVLTLMEIISSLFGQWKCKPDADENLRKHQVRKAMELLTFSVIKQRWFETSLVETFSSIKISESHMALIFRVHDHTCHLPPKAMPTSDSNRHVPSGIISEIMWRKMWSVLRYHNKEYVIQI